MASHRGRQLAYFATFAIAALLWLPAMYYQLDTPVGLVDRNVDSAYKFTSWKTLEFQTKVYFTFTDLEKLQWLNRFRPFLGYWNGAIWKYFGESSVHFANRWLFIFGAAAFLIAALRAFSRSSDAQTPYQVIPVAVLAYIWLLFPNSAFVLIEAVEVYTVFFLSICNYAAALMLTRRGATGHALFLFGFAGLLLSKETNVAVGLWLLASYWALAIRNRQFTALVIAGILASALLFVVWRIAIVLEVVAAQGGAYYIPETPLADRFPANVRTIIKGIFQIEVFVPMMAALCLPLLAPVLAWRENVGRELAFAVLLLGEFVSLFIVLTLQHSMELRYYGVLVPLLATLLALAASRLLSAVKWHKELARATAICVAIIVGLFVSANYYNFLYQFITQHSARNVDKALTAEVASLLDEGEYVAIFRSERGEQVRALIRSYAHQKYWPGSTEGEGIHNTPPSDPERPYYVIDIMGGSPPSNARIHAYLAGRTEYGILDYAAKLSGFLQGRSPYASIGSAPMPGLLGEYNMAIHAVKPKSAHNGD